MAKLYLDTNILLYSVEDSKNFYGKDISSSACRLMWAAISCEHEIVISTWALRELSKFKTPDQTNMIFSLARKKITIISYSEEDIAKAKEKNPGHFQDELHAMLALRSKADYLVTRNVNDFENVQGIKIVKPEELL